LVGSISCHSVAWIFEAPEFFDVEMDHVSWIFALVANDGLGWFEVLGPAQAGGAEHPAYGGW
jgi:hypothetical protein